MSEEQKGFLRRAGGRIGGYAANRFQPDIQRRRMRANAHHTGNAVKDALLPVTYDPEAARIGYQGRYPDGGVAAFARFLETTGTPLEALPTIRRQHVFNRSVFAVTAVILIAMSFWVAASSGGITTLLTAAATFIVSLGFIALSARFDYFAWQIDERRFGGVRAWIESRFS